MSTALHQRKRESYKIFDEIAGTYDFLNRLLSFGIDRHWRKKFLAQLPQKRNMDALDLACGTGDVPLVLAESKQFSKIQGMDLSKEMVGLGQQKVLKLGLENLIRLGIGDGCHIASEDNSYDVVTISFGIRNFSDPQKSLKDIYRVLRPGGVLLIMEFGLPKFFVMRWLYLLYFKFILPLIGNIISGHKDAYSYLNQTVEDFPYGEDFTNLMSAAKFENLKATPLSNGIAYLYRGEKLND
ncbi:MAG: bifunctional demethylmenaquinone methyltransferase/2-methoxy-6-polyprenyl-1,4-benzoquinol methylase UbiE [Halobacteriovoraceae bacterium]|jgi:demethylmenaquinone methyltransferase / 2-methoxy-6-polyprenyl-1,4-benzoquinol methylase|nr:bifunctional demethylmenaquinone methyltransferase/2-methoxy-6-polyprenyl-1,4-benzoquinol methylase UbiE [Halobacteriovoraceae bacterium]MBT5092897.1 bifunctional demethylmenaquinone methyltransferase/2-methoxy-6-polyprenyl-1,4-benzoquinol methylase UbiE [Halobacteriovoraceae bacterium]